MKTATLNLRHLRAAANAVSTEETRYYLNGVLVEITPRAVTYVATDGHILFASIDPVPRLKGIDQKGNQTDCGEGLEHTLIGQWIIPTATIKATKINRHLPTEATLSDEGGGRKLTLALPDASSLGFEPIDGTFPDWRRVIPQEFEQKDAKDLHNYNPTLVARLWRAFDDVRGEKPGKSVPTFTYNGVGPAMLSVEGVDAVGVVMPMRGATSKASPPAWIALGARAFDVAPKAKAKAKPEPKAKPAAIVEAPKAKPRLSYRDAFPVSAAA